MTSSPIHIICASDRAFLRHIPVMLSSLQAHTQAPLRVSVVSTDWQPEDQKNLQAALPALTLEFLTLPAYVFAGLSFKTVLSPLSYARCLMSDMIESDKFIYLDIDMILRADIVELWATDLGDAPAAAVFHGNVLNAGMMVINARVWRARGLGKTLLEWARENQPREADQEAIETLIGDEMLHLDERWNCLVDPIWGPHMLRDPAYIETAKLLHFITGFKPWNMGRYLLPRPYAKAWKQHCKRNRLPVIWKYEAKTLAWQTSVLLRRALGR